MEHHKNKQYTQCNGQHYPNPDKKGDMDSKDKESKIPRAKKGKNPHGPEDHPRPPLKPLDN